MPQFSALSALAQVEEAKLDVPFIVISGAVGEEAAVEVMRAGAHDFLLKHKLDRLVPAIERELREAQRRAQHKLMQGRVRQMEKLESLGQLTGGIAHDFNNILAVIIGMAELAAAQVADRPRTAAMIQQIDEAAERGAQLVQRLLAFARKQPQELRILDLNDAVVRAAGMLQRTLGEHIHLQVVLAPEAWTSVTDPVQLEAAIVNLAVNARDAMPGGGRLLIETANVVLDEHYAARNADASVGEHVAISVTDTGTGIPPDVIERVFEPFFTTKEVGRGTGLGLSMVYGFAKQSGGHVKIYSELGHGTSVRLYLPRAAEHLPAPPPAGTGPAAGAGGPAEPSIVLVVEDDAAVRSMAVSVLDGLGYRVREAPDGRKALDILTGSEHIDLLFTDMVMPNGLSGQDLINAARELRPGLRFLLTSGYSEHFIKAQREPGSDVHLLNKPYRRETLAMAVRNALTDDAVRVPAAC
jgi:signal transduction histidine kinase